MAMPQPVTALAIVALQVATTSIVVGFAARDSLLRLGGLAVTLLAAHTQLSEPRVQHPVARPIVGATSVLLALVYIDTALLSRWTFDAEGPTSSLGGLDPALGRSGQVKSGGKDSTEGDGTTSQQRSRSVAARLRFGFGIAAQSRFPCTPWGVKHTRDFDRSEIPSRDSFIKSMALKMAVCTLILRMGRPSGDPSQNGVLFSPAKIPLAGNVIDPAAGWLSCIDWEQLQIRLLDVFGYWTIQHLVISLIYDCIATLAVTLRLTGVYVWPPVFGRLDESWSLRQFWGEFHHQLIRRGSSSTAHFITYPVLHLPRGSLAARYVFMSLVFAVSAVFCLLIDLATGIPVPESGAVVFFCCQAPAIMLEDLVLAAVKRLAVSRGFGVTRQGTFSVDALPPTVMLIIRAIGYLWVIVWLACMSPVWIYPAMERDTGEPIIPF